MDFYEDGNDFGQIEECIENVLEESEYNGFDLDCTLLEEIIANDVNATASENSSDSGNHSPSSSSSTRELFQIPSSDDNCPKSANCDTLMEEYCHQEVPGNAFGFMDSHDHHNPFSSCKVDGYFDQHQQQFSHPQFSHHSETVHSINTPRLTSNSNYSLSSNLKVGESVNVEDVKLNNGKNNFNISQRLDKIQQPSTSSVTLLSRPQSAFVCKQAAAEGALKFLMPATLRSYPSLPYGTKQKIKTEPTTMHSPSKFLIATPIPRVEKYTYASKPTPYDNEIEEDFLRKKEDRKMRNRVSAQLSRQRKREELDKMKEELDKTKAECRDLRSRNQQLEQQLQEQRTFVEQLKFELHKLKAVAPSPPTKASHLLKAVVTSESSRGRNSAKVAGVCMLMLCLMVMPNYEELPLARHFISSRTGASNNYGSSERTDFPVLANRKQLAGGASVRKHENAEQLEAHYHGRALSTVADGIDLERLKYVPSTDTTLNLTNSGGGNGTAAAKLCGEGRYENDTIKLREDLALWIYRHEKPQFGQFQLGMGKQFPALRNSNRPPFLKTRVNDLNDARLQMKATKAKRSRINNRKHSLSSTHNQQLALPRDFHHRLLRKKQRDATASTGFGGSLFSALNAQTKRALVEGIIGGAGSGGDTLYILALRDYWLLPPMNNASNGTATPGHNTRRLLLPRLAIVMPDLSPPLNASSQLSMMRIECEVITTSVFYLNEDLVKSVKNSAAYEDLVSGR